jgi:heat shock protein HslJ
VFAEFVDATGAENLPVVPTPPLPNSLVGRTWAWLETVTPEATIGANDPTRYTVDFQADGTAAIKADCNTVLATYTTDGQSLTITPGPTTLVACPEDSQADQFIQQLSNAAVYFFQGDELFIDQFASAGTMRFVSLAATSSGPADESAGGTPPTGPAGQTFRVVSFGPAGAETPVITGTQITALFDTEQQLVSGSSGCNTYTGSLNTATGAFAIGPLASTMMACAEPAGIMEQETAFLAALGGATSFAWSVAADAVTTNGTINYTLADGTSGVINLVSP